MAEWLKDRLSPLASLSPFFLGLGVYRAWISIFLDGRTLDLPSIVSAHNLFDIAMVASLFLFAKNACRVPTFLAPRRLRFVGFSTLVLATVLGFVAKGLPEGAALALFATVLGGASIAVVILQWSELYSTLGPVRVCLNYSPSLLSHRYRGDTVPGQNVRVFYRLWAAAPFYGRLVLGASGRRPR